MDTRKFIGEPPEYLWGAMKSGTAPGQGGQSPFLALVAIPLPLGNGSSEF